LPCSSTGGSVHRDALDAVLPGRYFTVRIPGPICPEKKRKNPTADRAAFPHCGPYAAASHPEEATGPDGRYCAAWDRTKKSGPRPGNSLRWLLAEESCPGGPSAFPPRRPERPCPLNPLTGPKHDTREGITSRCADWAPAGGTRDTMSWARGPVKGLLGGDTSQGTLTGNELRVQEEIGRSERCGRAPSLSPARLWRRGLRISLRVVDAPGLRPGPVAPPCLLSSDSGDRWHQVEP
jgi:hypothetical protein